MCFRRKHTYLLLWPKQPKSWSHYTCTSAAARTGFCELTTLLRTTNRHIYQIKATGFRKLWLCEVVV
jgi:hypothetical protein